MRPFKIQKTGEFTTELYNEELGKAFEKLREENYISGFGKEIIKDQIEPAMAFGGKMYKGLHTIFQIQNHTEPIGVLNCFISLDRTFIYIVAI